MLNTTKDYTSKANKLSWQEELRTSIKTFDEFSRVFHAFYEADELINLREVFNRYQVLIPKSLALKILQSGKDSPLAIQFLPNHQEVQNQTGEFDPIGDEIYRKTPQIIHRYQNRLLFLPTAFCPVMCRYCFRKNELNDSNFLKNQNFDESLRYIKEHVEVNEIIFSGGDPLILSNEKIEFYLNEFSKINHIKFIRFHTRFLSILPSRIDKGFLKLIKNFNQRFKALNIVIHLNHTQELTPDVQEALNRLNHIHAKILCQSVLLKNVNDSFFDLKNLILELLNHNIRPYYLHHPDNVSGGNHFRVARSEAKKWMAKLRKELPGWSLPQYIMEQAEGQGKISAL